MDTAETNLVILGDSISVGLFSDSIIGKDLSKDSRTQFIDSLIVGGSFSKALVLLDSYYKKYGNGAFSRSQAEQSLFTLMKTDDPNIAVNNLGVSGSTVSQLEGQFNLLDKELLEKINYFVIVIGNNDICGHYKNPKFKEDFKSKLLNIVFNLYSKFKKSQIFLLPAFNVSGLLKFQDKNLSSSFEKLLTISNSKTCDDLQKQMCPLFSDTSKSIEDIDTLRTEINLIIKEATEYAAPKTKDHESFSFKDRVFYVDTLEELELKESFLAIDCFHPSAKAHTIMGKTIYDFIKSKGLAKTTKD